MTTTVRLIVAAAVCWVPGSGWWSTGCPSAAPTRADGGHPRPPARPFGGADDAGRRPLAGSRAQFRDEILTDLRLVQRLPETHAAMLVGAGVAGLFGPAAFVVILQAVGALSMRWSRWAWRWAAAVGPWLVHVDAPASRRDSPRPALPGCPRISTWSPCCWPATWATRVRCVSGCAGR